MSKPRSVIVVGGGIVGSCAALALTQAGVAVRHVSPADPEPASWGNAGHLATEHVEPLASLKMIKSLPRQLFSRGGPVAFVPKDVGAWLPWSLRLVSASMPGSFVRGKAVLASLAADAIPAWRRLLGEAADGMISADGHLVVWEGRNAQARGMAALAEAETGSATYRAASEAERNELAARLTLPELGAARFDGTGQVRDPGMLLDTIRKRLDEAGCERWIQRADLVNGGVFPSATLADGTQITADALVVAAGVWSGPLLRRAGLPAPLIAERGYHIGFDAPDWPQHMSPLVLDDRAVVVTRFPNGMRATSFVEFGRPDSPPDPHKWARLEQHLRDVGLLCDRATVTRWMGCRPTLPDYLPGIGGGEIAGLHYAVGHSHLGLTLAARTAEILRDSIIGEAPVPAGLSLNRFGAAMHRSRVANGPFDIPLVHP